MNAFFLPRWAQVAVGCLLAFTTSEVTPAHAARVSEPSTVFYGRVVQRLQDHEFLVSEGQLKWTLASPLQGGREYELTADLQPIGNGRYSYSLRIPHQLLAYDLSITGKAVPLTVVPTKLRHLKVTVNGKTANLVAPAVDGVTADQSTRASAYRIDLDVPDLSPDSDGDGVPDWWEDKYGTDKWNPNEGSFIPPATSSPELFEPFLTSFGEWRSLYFPGDQRDLNLFAAESSDGDNISHLLEYAFGLNPIQKDEARPWLPTMRHLETGVALQFGVRRKAADIAYLVEVSDDFLSWRKAEPAQVSTSVESQDPTFDRVLVHPLGGSDQSRLFLRVRVDRKP